VKHDARARRADRMADRDRAAVDVELVLVDAPIAPGSPSSVLQKSSSCHARRHAITCAANASLISSASMSASPRPFPLQERRGCVNRARGPSARIEPCPLRVDDAADGREAVRFDRTLGCEDDPRAAVVTCELLPAVTLPYFGRRTA
jgi:hypothetical protein